jgi:plasmid maintenance system antidote protein VapI
MTSDRFNECLALIGWSVSGVAKRMGVPQTRPRRWAEGRYPVPADVARWLEKLATAHERNPPPESA